jgi:hypothetical protein
MIMRRISKWSIIYIEYVYSEIYSNNQRLQPYLSKLIANVVVGSTGSMPGRLKRPFSSSVNETLPSRAILLWGT